MHFAGAIAERMTTRLFPSRTIKAVFVVNKQRIVGKRSTYFAVSSAVIRLYTSLLQHQSDKSPMLRRYLNQGQMKVVLKADNCSQLQSVINDAERRKLHTITINCGDRCLVDTITNERRNMSPSDDVGDEPAIVAVIGSIDAVDTVTGHLKLM